MPLKKISFVLTFLAFICLTTSVTLAEDYIELPFEYFYGRWAEGLQVDNYLQMQKHEDPKYFGSLAYIQPKYYLNFNYASSEGISNWYKSPDKFYYGKAVLRPFRNWQIGVDSVYFLRHHIAFDDLTTLIDTRYYRNFYLKASSNFLNKDNLRISQENGPFNYFIGPFYNEKSFRLDNLFIFRHKYRDTKISRLISNGGVETIQFDDLNNLFQFENSTHWTFMKDFQLNTNLSLKYIEGHLIAYNYRIDSSRYLVQNSLNIDRNYYLQYEINLLSGKFKPIYAEIYLTEGYSKYRRIEYFGEVYHREMSNREMYYTYYDDDPDLENDLDKMGTSLYYLSKSNFNSNIIIDDFNDFYHHMLFHNQIITRINFEFSVYELNDSRRTADLNYDLSYGLFDQFQVSASLSYEWRKSDFGLNKYYEERFYQEYNLSFRSFKYKPGMTTGWDDYDRMDIVYGRIMKFGQVYLEMSFTTPGLYSPDGKKRGFLAFDNLRNGHKATLTMRLIAGLGYGFMLEIQNNETYYSSAISRRYYTFSVAKRIKNFSQLNIKLTNVNRKHDLGSFLENPEINLEFNLFL